MPHTSDLAYAVPLQEAARLLGNKSRAGMYEAIAAGELEAIKDGRKTLITMRSICARQESLPPAKVRKLALVA
jgi:hypothetical protein